MTRRLRLASLLLPLLLATTGHTQQPSIDDFFQEFTDAWVRRDPDLAVSTAYFTGAEHDRLSRELTPLGREYELETVRIARNGLKRLDGWDRTALTPAQRQSADVMRWQLQALVDGEAFLDYDLPLEQMNGANVSLPDALIVEHPLKTERDAANYIARLKQVDERMGEATTESARQAAKGIVPPRFILDSTIGQMQRFIAPAPANSPLVTEFATKLEGVKELTAERRALLAGEAAAIVEREVYPAWRKAIATLESQRASATDVAGLDRFADGASLYATQLRRFTTTKLTAKEIHETGLREVARIESEMDALFRQLGYTEGTIEERVRQIQADQAYPDDEAGRKQIMADIDTTIADALRRTSTSFDLRPKAQVIAQPYPEFRWENSAASYTPPPVDGSRPGIFQMPLRPSRLTKFGLRTLVYHETVPGHHYQVALENENTALPAFRRTRALGGMSAPAEGWALYSERFAVEDGWYDGDVAGKLGQLSAALFRARRLVVDTGLHSMGWTRQQAIDYGIEASEVERYVVIPGQATSYMVGQLKLVELRDRVRAALGEGFTNREFHNVVLGVGVVPLDILEAAVDDYIGRTLAARKS